MPRQLTIRASRHRLQEEPPLHLSVATHNFVERGDSEVEVVVGEVWSRCGRGAVEQQTEVCNFRCSALRDLFMQSLRDGALSLPARGLRQGRRRRRAGKVEALSQYFELINFVRPPTSPVDLLEEHDVGIDGGDRVADFFYASFHFVARR